MNQNMPKIGKHTSPTISSTNLLIASSPSMGGKSRSIISFAALLTLETRYFKSSGDWSSIFLCCSAIFLSYFLSFPSCYFFSFLVLRLLYCIVARCNVCMTFPEWLEKLVILGNCRLKTPILFRDLIWCSDMRIQFDAVIVCAVGVRLIDQLGIYRLHMFKFGNFASTVLFVYIHSHVVAASF